MTGLETALIIGMGVGTAMELVGGLREASAIKAAGRAQQQEAEYRARQAAVQAGQERASAQRESMEQNRIKRLALSKAQAAGAATGGLDSSLITIMSALETEGGYRSDVALYEGETKAKSLEQESDLLKYQGEQARIAGSMKARAVKTAAIGKAATSLGTLYSKYSGGVDDFSNDKFWADGTPMRIR